MGADLALGVNPCLAASSVFIRAIAFRGAELDRARTANAEADSGLRHELPDTRQSGLTGAHALAHRARAAAKRFARASRRL